MDLVSRNVATAKASVSKIRKNLLDRMLIKFKLLVCLWKQRSTSRLGKKHSDLYTDENPKGTIHGLGFNDVATAKASVSKIRNSSRSHAHKIQAAVAMEQRAIEMCIISEAAV